MPELPWPELRSWSRRRIRLGIDNESSRFPRKFRSLDAVRKPVADIRSVEVSIL